MNATRKLYRVAMSETETYSFSVEAKSPEEAIALAEANWSESRFSDWKFEDAEPSGIDIIDEQEIVQ